MKTFSCVVCGDEYEPYRDSQKYCSKKCRDRVDKNARRFSGYREYILKRDGFNCTECDSATMLTVHHKDADKFNNVSDNLVTLCRSCHVSVHRKNNFGINLAIKRCFICGIEFYPLRKTHRLCHSKECRAEWKKINKRSEHDTIDCVVCSEPFVQKHSNHKCCSTECSQVYDLEQKQKRYVNNRDECLDRQKRYYAENKKQVKSYVKKWQQENADRLEAYYQKQKLKGKFRVNYQKGACFVCGNLFKPKTKRSLCCSDACLYKNKIRKNREAYHTKQ